MRESKIERYLRREVKKLGGVMEKFVSPAKRFVPDDIVSWGMYAHALDNAWPPVEFIECKAPDGKLSAGQKRDHDRRRGMGFQVWVIWNMEQAEVYLRARGKK